MVRKFVLGAVGALAMIGAASAADMKAPVYKAPPVFNWTGWYGGIQGGWGDVETFGVDSGGVATGPRSGDGWFGGLTLGYNWQARGSNLVLGLEVDGAIADINAISTSVSCATPCGIEVNGFSTFRARAGFTSGPVLFYATAGAAVGWVDSLVVGINNKETLWGWTAGGGIEWAFAPRWSMKLEYLYIELDDATTPTPFPVTWFNPELQIVRLGLNRRF